MFSYFKIRWVHCHLTQIKCFRNKGRLLKTKRKSGGGRTQQIDLKVNVLRIFLLNRLIWDIWKTLKSKMSYFL